MVPINPKLYLNTYELIICKIRTPWYGLSKSISTVQTLLTMQLVELVIVNPCVPIAIYLELQHNNTLCDMTYAVASNIGLIYVTSYSISTDHTFLCAIRTQSVHAHMIFHNPPTCLSMFSQIQPPEINSNVKNPYSMYHIVSIMARAFLFLCSKFPP